MELFHKQLLSVVKANKRLNIWDGPVRSGKSVASVVAFLKFILEDAPRTGEFFMIGKTVTALKRNIITPMQDMVGPECVYRSGDGIIKLWNRTINVTGANDERSEQKIRGSTSAGTYGDEIVLWPESFFRMATSRMSLTGSRFMGTTNPDSPNHWLKTGYLDRAGEVNLRRFHWGLRENTFLDQDYIDQIEAEYTGLWKKRFIDGLWVLAEGAIYDMFRDEHNTYLEHKLVPDEYIVGVDYGTNNPCVFILIGIIHNHMGKTIAWAEREYYYDSRVKFRQKTDSEYAQDMVHFIAQRDHRKHVAAIYIDPSAASFKLELKRRNLWNVKDADNDVSNGIRTVSRLIHQGRYKLHRQQCPMTIREYPGYVWDPKKAAKGVEEPIKENDHGKDAERYALHSHLGTDSILYTPEALKW